MSLTVAIPLYPSFDTLDVMGPLQAFMYAGFTSKLLAQTRDGVKSLEGVTVMPDDTFDCAGHFDLLLVPGGTNLDAVLALGPRGRNPYLNFLASRAPSATLVCSVCTGALLLGAAGLLDGCVATTHWAYHDVLRLFPCEVVPGNVVTGGGVSSGIDEALYIISVVAGVGAARAAQLKMQYNPQPIVHCGDPGAPDIRDNPGLPAEIRRQWNIEATKLAFEHWLASAAGAVA